MLSYVRGFWSRHKRKVLISLGIFGSGYFIYKYYQFHRRRILQLERQIEAAKEVDELNNLKWYEVAQSSAEQATLHYVPLVQSRISEKLDLSDLREKLWQGKGQANPLTVKEKLQLWDRFKVLSFTRAAASLWSMNILCLYSRVQYNILWRHKLLETARLESSGFQEEFDTYTKQQEEFLATAEYLCTHGFSSFIGNMQTAAEEVLKEKQLKETFDGSKFCETMIHILKLFMSIGEQNYWINYLVPENAYEYRQQMAMSVSGLDDSSILMDSTVLGQLISETRTVLLSPGFRNILEVSLKRVLEVLMEDFNTHAGVSSVGIPLAKLLPPVSELGFPSPGEPSNHKFVQAIRSLPDVELFYSLLYANDMSLAS